MNINFNLLKLKLIGIKLLTIFQFFKSLDFIINIIN